LSEAKSGDLRGVYVVKNYAECYGRMSAGKWAYRDVVYAMELYKRRILEEADE
jgi:hypothetical protein